MAASGLFARHCFLFICFLTRASALSVKSPLARVQPDTGDVDGLSDDDVSDADMSDLDAEISDLDSEDSLPSLPTADSQQTDSGAQDAAATNDSFADAVALGSQQDQDYYNDDIDVEMLDGAEDEDEAPVPDQVSVKVTVPATPSPTPGVVVLPGVILNETSNATASSDDADDSSESGSSEDADSDASAAVDSSNDTAASTDGGAGSTEAPAGYVYEHQFACHGTYLSGQSGIQPDVTACATACSAETSCRYFSFCPSGATGCTGGHENKCAMYSTCTSATTHQGYDTWERTTQAIDSTAGTTTTTTTAAAADFYLASTDTMAADACFASCGDAYVAMPQSSADITTIGNLLPSQYRNWIGLKRDSGAWKYNNMAYTGWTNWHSGEGTTGEVRAAMVWDNSGWDGDWYDMNNDGRAHYCVCMREATATTTTTAAASGAPTSAAATQASCSMKGPWTDGYVICGGLQGCEYTKHGANSVEQCKALCCDDDDCESIDWNPGQCITKTKGIAEAKAANKWHQGYNGGFPNGHWEKEATMQLGPVITLPDYNTGELVEDIKIGIGSSDFTININAQPTELTYSILAAMDYAGKGTRQFRLELYESGVVGFVCTGIDMENPVEWGDPNRYGSKLRSTTKMTVGTLTRVTITREHTMFRLYVDGKQESEYQAGGVDVLTDPADKKPFRLGSRLPAVTDPFHGKISGDEYVLGALTPEALDAKLDREASDAVVLPPKPDCTGLEGSAKNICSVLVTLYDILVSVMAEEHKEQGAYTEFEKWCATERATTLSSLDLQQKASFENQASVLELTASVQQFDQMLKDTSDEAQSAKDAITSATSVHEQAADKHEQDMQLNTESIKQITEAIRLLSVVHEPTGRTASAAAAAAASFLQTSSASTAAAVAASFLQTSTLRGHAKKHAHVHKRGAEPGESAGIYGIMKQIKKTLESEREGMSQDESTRITDHNAFMSTQQSRLGGLTNTLSVKQQEHTNSRVRLVEVTRLAQDATNQVTKLTEVEADVDKECLDKAKWWRMRQEDRKLEKQALVQAMEFLEKASTDAKEGDTTDDDSEEEDSQAVSFVQTKSKKHHGKKKNHKKSKNHVAQLSAATAQLAAIAVSAGSGERQKGALDTAKKVVEQLLELLQNEQKEETNKYKYCQDQIEKKDGEKAEVIAEIERLDASIERKSSEIDLLQDEMDKIIKDLDDGKKAIEKGEEIRKSETAIYEAGKRDRELTVKVLTQAKEVLKDFYRTEDTSSDGTAGSGRQTLSGEGVMKLLDKIIDDINKDQADAQMQENTAQTEFEQTKKDYFEEFDKQMVALTQRKKLKAKTLVQLGTDRETHTQKVEDRGSVEAQLDNLHTGCDELLQNHEQRLQGRNFESDQLKDVIDILSGSQIAARTGFIQDNSQKSDSTKTEKRAKAMDEQEAALLRDLTQVASNLASPAKVV